jgi:GTP-sensing pleiotropic transcriptional regulator CodY
MSVEKLSKIVELLRKEAKVSPSQIAETIGSDRRTVDKVLNIAENLSIISCKRLEMAGRTYKTCELNPDFRRILQKRSEHDEPTRKSE